MTDLVIATVQSCGSTPPMERRCDSTFSPIPPLPLLPNVSVGDMVATPDGTSDLPQHSTELGLTVRAIVCVCACVCACACVFLNVCVQTISNPKGIPFI